MPSSSFYATTEYDSDSTAYQASYSTPYSWSSEYGENGILSVAGEEYLEIDLLSQAQIAYIGTKGGVLYTEWVTSYKVQYSIDSNTWTWYNNEETLTGNEDSDTEVINKLISPIIAQYIRIYPMSAYYWVGMRVEAYGRNDLTATLPPAYFTTTPAPTCMYINISLLFCLHFD